RVLAEIYRRCAAEGIVVEETEDLDLTHPVEAAIGVSDASLLPGADLVVEDGTPTVVMFAPEALARGPERAHLRRLSATMRRRTRLNADRAAERGGGTSDPVRMYLREIGRVPLLVAAEEVDLAKRIEAGAEASERLADLDAAGSLGDLPADEAGRLPARAGGGRRPRGRVI